MIYEPTNILGKITLSSPRFGQKTAAVGWLRLNPSRQRGTFESEELHSREAPLALAPAGEKDSSTAARYESLIRISNSIRALQKPQDLFEILFANSAKQSPS